MLHQVLFIIFGLICIAGAVNLLAQKHPISSALSLIVVMGALAVLYLLLGAEFPAAVQVIIYAGAIMVLFVFVIMLLNAGEEVQTTGSRVAPLLGFPAVVLLAILISWVLIRHTAGQQLQLGGYVVTVNELGAGLFRQFMLPFEVTSVLILIAIMGAVYLARREE